VAVLEPVPPPANRGVIAARASPETFAPGGVIVAEIGGNDAEAGEVALAVGAEPVARGLAAPGASVALGVERVAPGWHAATVQLPPDELRADDLFHVALRGATPAAVTADGAGEFVATALAALTAIGRVHAGRGVVLGDRPAAGATVILPPDDPARIAAVNQALAARGLRTRYGVLVTGEWTPTSELLPLDAVTVRQRYRLEGTGEGTPLAVAGGEPWLLRDGDAIVVASRFEEPWTDLPLRPTFIPFLDALVNRMSAGEAWQVQSAPGDPVRLPGSSARLLLPGGVVAVSPGVPTDAPLETGTYFVADAVGDTVGALLVNPDPRESDLRVASDRAIRDQLGGATLAGDPDRLALAAFAARRAELTTLLLVLALTLAVVELILATLGGGPRRRAA